jgi:hypothetical protein
MVFLIPIPGALILYLLALSSNSASPGIAALHLGHSWVRGLGVGLSVAALYYGPIDSAKRRLRKRAHAVAHERDGT